MVSSVFGQSGIDKVNLQANLAQTANIDRLNDATQKDFHELLLASGSKNVSAQNMTDEQKVRLAAEQLVASTMLKPILSQIRQDPFKSDLFHGGRTEEIFGEQLDNIIADRMVSKQGFGLVDSVYKNFMNNIEQDSSDNNQGIDLHG